MSKSLFVGCFIGVASAFTALLPAQALTFNFSFSNTTGNTAGTVSGTISDLVDNTADQTASQVIITSYPPGLGTLDSNVSNATGWAGVYNNSFTVTSGNITEASFKAQTGSTLSYFLCLGTACGSDNELSFIDNTDYYNSSVHNTANNDGLSGVTFSPASVGVPEPNSILGLIAGTGFLLFLAKKYRDQLAVKI